MRLEFRHPLPHFLSILSWALLLGHLTLSATPSAGGELFVVTTTFEVTGSTSRMDLDAPFSTTVDEFSIHSDAVVRRDGCRVYVLNRLFADNVLVLDACNGYSVVTQFSTTATGLNPQDIEIVAPDKAYITLYESGEILIVDPRNGQRRGTIDLSGFADADGLPEVEQMVRLGNRLFVVVQRVDRDQGWIPAGGSGLAVIDTERDALVDADPETPVVDLIALQLQVPQWRLEFVPALQRIVALSSGAFLAFDGGLELVNPWSLESEGPWILESELQADVLDFAFSSPSLLHLLTSDLNFDTCLISLDPASPSARTTQLCTSGFQLSDLERSADGRLFVADRSPTAPGIRIFDATTGSALAGPIDVGLPPFDMVLLEYLVTDSHSPPRPMTALEAVPNPFNPRAELRLREVPRTAILPRIRILDARGRQVRTLEGKPDDGGAVWIWDGRSDTGRPAPSGVYRAILEDGSASTTLSLVR